MKKKAIVAAAFGLAAVLVAALLLARYPSGAGGPPAVDLDLSVADGEVRIRDVVAVMAVEPRPAHAFEELTFRFAHGHNSKCMSTRSPPVLA